ncbi:MAG: hypothetical protein ACR2LS_07290 [Thermomicrobiales bacterium]
MKRCPRCGRANEAEANFGFHCGLDLRGSRTVDRGGDQAGLETEPDEVAPKARSRWVTVTLAVIATVLLACVAFFVWALTPAGQGQMSDFATWAANEATRQAGQ